MTRVVHCHCGLVDMVTHGLVDNFSCISISVLLVICIIITEDSIKIIQLTDLNTLFNRLYGKYVLSDNLM